MRRQGLAILCMLPLGFLAACANMPMEVASAPPMPPPPAPPSAPPPVRPDAARTQFIAGQRAEAKRLEGTGDLSSARQHWRYVLALVPDDAEAQPQIARLDILIRTKRDAALAQGEAAMMRGQAVAARTAFLRVLALDGTNDQARRRLLELETRAAFQRQDRKDAQARAARAAGMPVPETE